MFVVTITVGILGGILSHVCCHDNRGILGGILSQVCCQDNSGHTGRNIESGLLSRNRYWYGY